MVKAISMLHKLGRGGLYLTPHCHHQNDSALRWAAVKAILMFLKWETEQT